ncbi:MAG: CBS domain-containing protein [Desulforhopalus sp.]
MRAKDIMEPVTSNWLRPEQTLYDAICTMRKTKWEESSVNGMVVLEHGIKLIGIVSIKDVIRAVIPPYFEDNLGGFTWEGMLEDRTKKAGEVLVQSIMSTKLITIGAEDQILHCADLMIDKDLQRLPVVDKSGRVLGMVHIRDVYLAITNIMCKIGE